MTSTAAPRAVGQAFGPGPWWAAVQAAGLAGVVALVAGALLDPGRTLPLFWNLVLPVLPLTFLVNPNIWRAVCPLATLNMMTGRPGRRRHGMRVSAWAGLTGMLLLLAIVPARRFLIQGNGVAFAALVVACGLLALVAGLAFEAKAGFCNAICPVLPVERLYGQRPLVKLPNARCHRCELCTPRGCLDLALGQKASFQVLGPSRRTSAWTATAFGTFAGAFPGFVFGFGSSGDVPASQAWLVYGWIVLCALASWLAVRLVVRRFQIEAARALPVLAAVAAGTYYWFAGPAAARALELGSGAGVGIRVTTMAAVAGWYALGTRRR